MVLVGLATLVLPAMAIRHAVADIRAGRAARRPAVYIALAVALVLYGFARFVGFDLAAWNSCAIGG